MALFDIFKNKEGEKELKKTKEPKAFDNKEKKETFKKSKVLSSKKDNTPVAGKKPKENIEKIEPIKPKKTILSDVAFKALKSPHVTEKATILSEEQNAYVFKINKGTNKKEVKEAVENTYGVNVVRVRVINIPRRKRRIGKSLGWAQGYKKAIVKIKEGQKIEILSR